MVYEIWKYEQGFNKVYVEQIDTREEILSLKECKLQCTYYKNGRLEGWDIIYPVSKEKQIIKILKRNNKQKAI